MGARVHPVARRAALERADQKADVSARAAYREVQAPSCRRAGMTGAATIELALIEKSGGPLTKAISLDSAGAIKSDGAACVMLHGIASRLRLTDIGALADTINQLGSRHALTLGKLRLGLPDTIRVLTKRKINDNSTTNVVARTVDNFIYEAGCPGVVLFDF